MFNGNFKTCQDVKMQICSPLSYLDFSCFWVQSSAFAFIYVSISMMTIIMCRCENANLHYNVLIWT